MNLKMTTFGVRRVSETWQEKREGGMVVQDFFLNRYFLLVLRNSPGGEDYLHILSCYLSVRCRCALG